MDITRYTWRKAYVGWRAGRWSGDIDPHGIPRPRLVVHGEGDDYAYVAFMVDDRSSDPVFRIEVDLQGTWVGRRVCAAAAATRDIRHRLTGHW